jgi:hypothetical protein
MVIKGLTKYDYCVYYYIDCRQSKIEYQVFKNNQKVYTKYVPWENAIRRARMLLNHKWENLSWLNS